jgi:CRISPR system Cascade subunit CasB
MPAQLVNLFEKGGKTMNTPDPGHIAPPPDKPTLFVLGIIDMCLKNKGYAARLKRSDNPATEYQSWEILASYGIDLEKKYLRLPYATVAAAIAKAKPEKSGQLTLGQGIASCYEDGNAGNQARAKLRRLLACHDTSEVCRIIRPLFSLIHSKSRQILDYAWILKQLLRFYWDPQAVKAQWAQEFYRYNSSEQGDEE